MKDIEDKVRAYLVERKWDRLRPGDLAKSVSIEAGELLELFQWENPTLEEVKGDAERIEKLKRELADVLIYCIDIAVLLDLDTRQLIEEKLEHIQKKYPAELFEGRAEDREPGTEDIYWKIKQEHRARKDV